LKRLKAFNDTADRCMIAITNILLALGMVFICIEVFTRYILGTSHAFFEEQAKYYMLWFVYLILGVVSSERRHVRIDVVPELLKGKSREVFEIFVHLSVVVFCLIVGPGMVDSIHSFYVSGMTPPTEFALPEWVPRLVLPVGLFVLLLRNIQLVIDGILTLIGKEHP